VVAVYEVTRGAVERARGGGGPTLVELMTYRRKGHAEHDNQSYVSRDELESWARKDPLDTYVRRLIQTGWARTEELENIDRKILAELNQAVDACENEALPAPETALDGVLADPPRAPTEWYRSL
jgi:pyruvate dehydrogenase E1 component alpha subunit/2-oxoisovalerate dehydrogenase E1 component alpha subunit